MRSARMLATLAFALIVSSVLEYWGNGGGLGGGGVDPLRAEGRLRERGLMEGERGEKKVEAGEEGITWHWLWWITWHCLWC